MSEARGEPVNITRGVPAPAYPWPGDGYIAAHEIGHLFGGSHDYANCVEGVLVSEDAIQGGPCTLMHENLNISYGFSTLNRAVIRGYATEFASP